MMTRYRNTSVLLFVVGLLGYGSAIAQDVLTVKNNRVGVGETDPDFILHIKRSDGQGAGFKVETTNAPANINWFFQQNAVTGAFLISPFEGGNSPMQVFPGDGNIIRNTLVLRGGRVGIGTQSPQGTLDVNGSIYQRGAARHPDYVFEPEYKLESIEEHAEYMWGNKHLPAVGPGQYDSEGFAVIEVGAQSKGMLEELEKAHIYIEMLNAQIKELKTVLEKQQRYQEYKDKEISDLRAAIESISKKELAMAEPNMPSDSRR